MLAAYACRISRENMPAIASECPGFDLAWTLKWLEEHETGYFIRDEGSPFDCHYMVDTVFHQIYMFESGGSGDLFRRIFRLK